MSRMTGRVEGTFMDLGHDVEMLAGMERGTSTPAIWPTSASHKPAQFTTISAVTSPASGLHAEGAAVLREHAGDLAVLDDAGAAGARTLGEGHGGVGGVGGSRPPGSGWRR